MSFLSLIPWEVVCLYVAAAVLGLCCLFAYNSFLSSPSYLEHYFQFAAVKHTNNVATLPKAQHPSFWNNISTWVTVLMMVPMFLLQFAMLSPWVLRQKLQHRMITGALGSLVAVLLVPVCAARGGVSESSSMAVLIIACIVAGGSTTVLESALYAFFGSLPTKYMTGFVVGGGFSGSINSVLRIVITVSLPPSFSGVKTSAVIFFVIGMALMVVTVVLALVMRFSPVVRSYCADYRREGDVARCAHAEDAERRRLAACDEAEADISGSSEALHKMDHAVDGPEVDGAAHAPVTCADDQEVEEAEPSVFAVARKIWPMMLCLTANMFTTLVLFPGIGLKAMQESKSSSSSSSSSGQNGNWGAEAVMPMVVILMYNAGDTIGRLICNFEVLWCPKKFVPVVVVARAIGCVIPLALGICSPKVINSNANPIVVFLILGITNGYLIALTMAYGSSDPLLTKRERGIAGACLCFALLVGTTSGSILSLLILTFAL